ncbi:MAG: pitrilysin family protein [Pseudomonadota bacterium]
MIRFALAAVAVLFAAIPARAAVYIQEITSPGGITAWLVEEHTIPFAALEIRFKGGGTLDAPGKRGAVNMMTGLLEEGTGDLDAQAFAAARESLAASFGFDARDGSLSVSARFLTENRDEAIGLLRGAMVEPAFDPDAIERVRAQILSILGSEAKDPNEIARRTFDELAFGDHPYGSQINGTPESVAALTRDDLLAAHRATMARDRVFVGAVGDITPEELGALLDTVLGDLPETGAPQVDRAPNLLSGGVTVVPFDTPQSVLLFGHEGITRDDPDFFAAFVANQILGGSGLRSRLTREVRVNRGLTYGIGSYLVNMDQADLVLGQTSTVNARVSESLDVIRDQWADIAENGVTEDELNEAKTFLTGSYPLRFDGNGPIARILAGMQMQGLPIDYVATRNDRVDAVTMEDVRRVAARIYRPDDLHVVIVGEPEGLEASN